MLIQSNGSLIQNNIIKEGVYVLDGSLVFISGPEVLVTPVIRPKATTIQTNYRASV